MIHAMQNIQSFELLGRPSSQTAADSSNEFAELFGAATSPVTKQAAVPTASTDSTSTSTSTGSSASTGSSSSGSAAATTATSLGDPNVQGWLTSFFTEFGDASAANVSYQPGQGSANDYPTGSVFGPDAIFSQALANQAGNSYATLAGISGATLTSQLPGIPTVQAQQQFDQRLAQENLGRLQSGQPIDTTAYWSDPGPITSGGVTYTSAELGYAGPGQSSGPQPIYISEANQVGPDTYSVGGYNGTVTGIQPGRFYTLQQLEQAGLPAGQPDAQYHPGSWTTTQNA
jgi:hypothetical protein